MGVCRLGHTPSDEISKMRPLNLIVVGRQTALFAGLALTLLAPEPETRRWELCFGNDPHHGKGRSVGGKYYKNRRNPNGRWGKKHLIKGARP